MFEMIYPILDPVTCLPVEETMKYYDQFIKHAQL